MIEFLLQRFRSFLSLRTADPHLRACVLCFSRLRSFYNVSSVLCSKHAALELGGKNILGAACPDPPGSLSRAKTLRVLEVRRGGPGVGFSVGERVAARFDLAPGQTG